MFIIQISIFEGKFIFGIPHHVLLARSQYSPSQASVSFRSPEIFKVWNLGTISLYILFRNKINVGIMVAWWLRRRNCVRKVTGSIHQSPGSTRHHPHTLLTAFFRYTYIFACWASFQRQILLGLQLWKTGWFRSELFRFVIHEMN